MNAQAIRRANIANWTAILVVLFCLIGGLWYSQGPGAAERHAAYVTGVKAEAQANLAATKARIAANQTLTK